MHIGLVDNAFKHHTKTKYSNEYIAPSYPFEWDRSCQSDWVVFTDSCTKQASDKKFEKKKKIAWLLEPYEIQSGNYNFVQANQHNFEFIFTSNLTWISSLENGIYIPFGGTWIYRKDWWLYQKSKNMSIVASNKNFAEGHRLRHKIIDFIRKQNIDCDIYGRVYNPVDYKLETLKHYKYQIVIENVWSNGWFTEKLIDCFLTGTIPIYWGGPTADKFFNPHGIFLATDLEQLQVITKDIEEVSSYYPLQNNAIRENFSLAKEYVLPENHIWKFMKDKI